MGKFIEPVSRQQQSLLPRSVEEYVPVEDVARYIDGFVNELDLSEIEKRYSYEGRKGFSPQTMLKLLVYGKIRGIHSSRELSQACDENLKFIYITSSQTPDFRTISLFRKRFSKELARVLHQTIVIGLESGVIDLKCVAIDGTLIKSFAAEESYRTPEKIAEELERLEGIICEDITRDDANDQELPSAGKLPKNLQEPAKLKARLKEALAKHSEYNDKPSNERPKSISLTDPDCRKTRKGPAYNSQAAIDCNSRMIVGGYACNAVSDAGQLWPGITEVKENTGSHPKAVLADAGYSAKHALREMADTEIEAYVAQKKTASQGYSLEQFNYDQKSDSYTCPNGKVLKLIAKKTDTTFTYQANKKDCLACPLKDECMRFKGGVSARTLTISANQSLVEQAKQRTSSTIGKQMAILRCSTIETAFAHIKYIRKLRRFIFRGLSMIDAMWKFELAVYNIEQLIRLKLIKTKTLA